MTDKGPAIPDPKFEFTLPNINKINQLPLEPIATLDATDQIVNIGVFASSGIQYLVSINCIYEVNDNYELTRIIEIENFNARTDAERFHLGLSHDENFLCFSCFRAKSIFIFDLQNRRQETRSKGGRVEFSPNTYEYVEARNKVIAIMPNDFLPESYSSVSVGHNEEVYSMAYSPLGTVFATVSWDKTLKFWDTRDWKLLHSVEANENHLKVCKFSPDGNFLATAGNNSHLRIWNAHDFSLEYKISCAPVDDVCWSKCGRYIGVASRQDFFIVDIFDQVAVGGFHTQRKSENVSHCFSDPNSPRCAVVYGGSVYYFMFPHFANVKSARNCQ